MRIGIFGGTFNPIHLGHLRSALDIKNTFLLDKILFIPTGIPPHKKDNVAPIQDRMNMLRIAVDNIDGFEVSDIEAKRRDICYAIDTVKILKEKYRGIQLFYIVGTDAFSYIHTWKNYEELLRNISFIVMVRPKCMQEELQRIENIRYIKVDKKKKFSNKTSTVYLYPVTQLDISSSFIRLCVKKRESIDYFTPKNVIKYIKKRDLYKENE